MSISERIKEVPLWRHKIILPDGSVTPGSQDNLEQLPKLGLPSHLAGKSVLDIGCSDGFFSFECEKRGAARVVALDDFSSVYIDRPNGFWVAHEILKSKVEFVQGDFLTMELASLGKFDIVLFLGVMYHLRHPFYALEKLAEVCNDQIIVETEVVPERSGLKWKLLRPLLDKIMPEAYMTFIEGDQLNRDPTNWWVQSRACVEGMLRACGFCDVRTVDHGWCRGIFHGFSPAHGEDVEKLRTVYSQEILKEALLKIVGSETTDLKTLSISQFGKLKQEAAVLVAKKWHRHDRWNQP
jgi:tRNA (mo5U34)-methyltransferase